MLLLESNSSVTTIFELAFVAWQELLMPQPVGLPRPVSAPVQSKLPNAAGPVLYPLTVMYPTNDNATIVIIVVFFINCPCTDSYSVFIKGRQMYTMLAINPIMADT